MQRRAELNPWGQSPEDDTRSGSPNWWYLMLIARLAPGLTIKQAVVQANPQFQAAAYASLGVPDPKLPKVELTAVPAKGVQGLNDSYRESITILMVLVSLVLVIACSNVAMLIIARNAARQRELGLRMALGARRTTVFRQLLMESIILVVPGASFGWLFATVATPLLAHGRSWR